MAGACPNRNPASTSPQSGFWLAAALLFAGFLLRVYFLRRHAFLSGDSYLYQDIAQNWLYQHLYGLSTDAAPRPTLIRLPGYPAILAALGCIFDRYLRADPGTLRSFWPVLWLQVAADLGTCWLVSRLALRSFGRKAALWALALACLCPFTANYTAVPLTETFTIFFLALAFDALQRWMKTPSWKLLVLLSAALSASVLLRPDQGLLAVSILPVLFFAGQGHNLRERAAMVAACAVLASVPFIPWTVRNLRTFGVFQPLASRLAIDPGETAPVGFQHWYRTWAVDFSSTEDAYWKYPEETVQMRDLPDRAFDSSAERAQVADLLQRTAVTHKLNAGVEAEFLALAEQRTRAHPWRTHVLMPVARLANMLFHPRDEILPVPERWWQFDLHPRATIFAWCYAALGFAYFAAGVAGSGRALRANWMLAASMIAYVVLRCLLLLTLDNAEQRYTLEFFPVAWVFAASLFAPGYRRSLDAIQNC